MNKYDYSVLLLDCWIKITDNMFAVRMDRIIKTVHIKRPVSLTLDCRFTTFASTSVSFCYHILFACSLIKLIF